MGEKEGELKTEPQSNERLRFKGGVTCKKQKCSVAHTVHNLLHLHECAILVQI